VIRQLARERSSCQGGRRVSPITSLRRTTLLGAESADELYPASVKRRCEMPQPAASSHEARLAALGVAPGTVAGRLAPTWCTSQDRASCASHFAQTFETDERSRSSGMWGIDATSQWSRGVAERSKRNGTRRSGRAPQAPRQAPRAPPVTGLESSRWPRAMRRWRCAQFGSGSLSPLVLRVRGAPERCLLDRTRSARWLLLRLAAASLSPVVVGVVSIAWTELGTHVDVIRQSRLRFNETTACRLSGARVAGRHDRRCDHDD
jgi:hypothetical protein